MQAITSFQPPNIQTSVDDTIGNVLLQPNNNHQSVHSAFAVNEEFNHPTLSFSGKEQQLLNDNFCNLAKDAKAYHRFCRQHRLKMKQRCYRTRQRKLATDLEETNLQLRGEIKRMIRQRNSTTYGISSKESMWSVAVEYFRVFKSGLLAPEDSISDVLDSLQSNMAPDLDAGTVRGFKALVNNWRVFTKSFQDVQLQLQSLQQISETLLVATTTTTITISASSMENMFPHLTNKADGTWSPLASMLLGYRFVMHGSVSFHWDNTRNRVVRLISKVDMVSPMLQVFGNLEDVSRVFNGAGITLDGCIIVQEG